MNKKCLVCGKDFHCYKSTYSKKKYCSKECREKVHLIFAKCIVCKKDFSIAKSKYIGKNIKNKCCSNNCYNNFVKQKKEEILQKNTHVCNNCGKIFVRKVPSTNILFFCSQECSIEYMRGYLSPFYRGGSINSQGYKIIKINGKSFYEHRIIMEDYIGRKLDDNEDVHHKDGNKLNNDISNLEIINKTEHGKIHAHQRWNNVK